jgi:nitroreductase
MNVFDAIKMRRSVRSYSDKPIPADVMTRIRQMLQLAPSACNNQPWHFILVTDAAIRQQIAQASQGPLWVAQAPLIVIGCGLAQQAYKKMGGCGNSVEVDVSIALDHLSLGSVAEGLGTCWIGAFDEAKVKALLNIPEQFKVVAMMPVGYPSSPDMNREMEPGRRKLQTEIFSTDRFDG